MKKAKEVLLDLIGHSKRARTVFFTVLILLVIIGVLLIHYTWVSSLEATTEHAVRMAKVAEVGFSIKNIENLNVNLSDLDTEEYDEIKNGLIMISSHHVNIEFAYIYTMRNGKIYFIADSEPPESEDYSPPGQEFTEADEVDKKPFQDGMTTVTKPLTDRWGTWISVEVPMKDLHTGEVIAVFGFDYPANMWYSEAIKQTTQVSAIVVSMLLVYLFIFAMTQKNIIIRNEKRKLASINEKLAEQEELFRTVFEQSPIGIAISGTRGITDANPMFEKIVGRSNEEILSADWAEYSHPDDVKKDIELLNQFYAGEINGYSMHKRYFKPDGTVVWANIILAPLKIADKSEIKYLCLVEDITERLQTERDLLESERSKSVLLSNLPGMAYRCKYDRNWTMEIVSRGCYDLTGYPAESLIGNRQISFKDLILPEYQEYLWNKWGEELKKETKLKEEYEILTASGKTKWVFEQGQGIYDEDGNIVALEGLIIDITDRKKKEEEILYLNHHDYLTGIYNRGFIEKEEDRIGNQLPLSVIVGDINGVKIVNDAFGHAEGDILIIETAKILQSCCREGDILARTGGDEFMILLPKTDSQTASAMVNSIKCACEVYNQNADNEAYSFNISLGFSTKETEEEDFRNVIKTAEDYMYKHKLLEHKSSHSVILSSIRATMHEKSYETQEHAERITRLSKKVGERLLLSQSDIDELVLLATLHDIGKVGIDERILNKKGLWTKKNGLK